MGHQIGWGLMLVFLGGMLNGSFAAPMKRLSAWRWENTWLVYAVTGLLILPWVIALATVPHLGGVLQQASGSVLAKVAFFGFAWGIGAVLFGQGIARVGLALGFAVILGITSSFGALLPLAILHPDQLGHPARRGADRGDAGHDPRARLPGGGGEAPRTRAGFRRGGFGALGLWRRAHHLHSLRRLFLDAQFCFCFRRGNAATLASGGGFDGHVGQRHLGAGVSCGFLPNAAYCVYLLNKNHTWGVFLEKAGGAGYVLGATLMGVLWYSGLVVYGMGADALGTLGKIVGWPVFMSLDIIAGILWGFLGGEWKGASRTALGYCLTGIAILFLAIGVISFGNAP